jgi:PAS domain S-box-containing protein
MKNNMPPTQTSPANASQETGESQFFRLLFANNPLPMWIYNLETMQFLDVNHAAVERYGYSRDEFLQMKLTNIRPEADVTALLDHVARERPELQHSGEWRHRLKNGEIISVQITSHQVPFSGQDAVLVVAQDITERKRAEASLRDSEARFRKVFEEVSIGMALTDRKFRFLNVNQVLCEMLGYQEEELKQLSFLQITHPDDIDIDVELTEQLFAGEIPSYQVEKRYITKDDRVLWINLRKSVIRDAAGRPPQAIAAIENITARKQVEEENRRLLEREQAARQKAETAQKRLAFLAEASKILASSLDYERTLSTVAELAVPDFADWCVVDMARQGGQPERLAVYHSDPEKVRLAGELYRRFSPDPSRQTGSMAVMRTGQPQMISEIPPGLIESMVEDEELLAILRDLQLKSTLIVPISARDRILGSITWVMAESGRIYDQVDLETAEELARHAAMAVENARLYLEAQNLNEELEERVERRTAQLERANQELEAFTYSVSHDLRAPLRSISGFSQALLDDYYAALDETGKHYLQRCQAAAQRMGLLIDDLLRLSRITRSELKNDFVDLSSIARNVAGALQRREPDRKAQFVIEEGVGVEGDESLLRIMLENLFDNAWKFSGKQDYAIIKFGVRQGSEEERVFFVQDNGVGFDMAYADKLFGAFQRLHSFEAFSGTGIGLATVQRIVHRHEGHVWAEAAVDQGATFYFTLGRGNTDEEEIYSPS